MPRGGCAKAGRMKSARLAALLALSTMALVGRSVGSNMTEYFALDALQMGTG
jgi:hypothetical protein